MVGKTQRHSESHQVHEEEESKQSTATLHTAQLSRPAVFWQRQRHGGGRSLSKDRVKNYNNLPV